MRTRRSPLGMTVLELMIVLAIIGGGAVLVRSGFRMITKADLVENATELSAMMKRTSELSIEHGELHRVVFDLDKQIYVIEVCQGATAIMRNEQLQATEEERKRAADDKERALARGRERLQNLPSDALQVGDPEEATKRATAVSGSHIADRTCVPVQDAITGTVKAGQAKEEDKQAHQWVRALRVNKGIKFKEIWVQHRDESVTKGQVAVYFFPQGSSEKAVIELTDGSEVFTVLVFGLTGRIELRDGVLKDVNTHMLRNALGDKDAQREDQR